MKKQVLQLSGLLLVAANAGCASAPRPKSLDQSQALAQNPNLNAARELAPQAFAHAEQLRIRAEQTHSDGRHEEADALALQSLVAYDRAATMARQLELEQQRSEAEAAAKKGELEVARVAALQARVADETQALERSVELERGALPRQPIEPESGKRAEARAEAARSIAEAARLLCVAARLVAPQHEQAAAALTKAEALLTTLPTLAAHTALERALDIRVECLAALTSARSSSTRSTQEPDALLSKLSASMSDLRPHQDDRGIVLTDYGTWEGAQLSPHGADVVGRISAVAQANESPVLVVLHASRASGTQSAQEPNLDAIATQLRSKSLNASVQVVRSPLPSMLELPLAKERGRTEFILMTSK